MIGPWEMGVAVLVAVVCSLAISSAMVVAATRRWRLKKKARETALGWDEAAHREAMRRLPWKGPRRP